MVSFVLGFGKSSYILTEKASQDWTSGFVIKGKSITKPQPFLFSQNYTHSFKNTNIVLPNHLIHIINASSIPIFF